MHCEAKELCMWQLMYFSGKKQNYIMYFIATTSSGCWGPPASLKSHQMTTFFVQNDKVFTQMMIVSLFFELKKLSLDEFLMTT